MGQGGRFWVGCLCRTAEITGVGCAALCLPRMVEAWDRGWWYWKIGFVRGVVEEWRVVAACKRRVFGW